MNFTEELRYDYPLTPDSIVIDCGGYEGRFAAEIARRYGCRVEVYEPVPHFFQKCMDTLKGLHGVTLLPFGICGEGDELRLAKFKIKGDSTGNFADEGTEVEVGLLRADGIISTVYLKKPFVDLLKLNIEGGEFEVLDYLIKTGLVKNVKNIQVQWHAVIPDAEAARESIMSRLSLTHELSWDFGWTWQNWRIKP